MSSRNNIFLSKISHSKSCFIVVIFVRVPCCVAAPEEIG